MSSSRPHKQRKQELQGATLGSCCQLKSWHFSAWKCQVESKLTWSWLFTSFFGSGWVWVNVWVRLEVQRWRLSRSVASVPASPGPLFASSPCSSQTSRSLEDSIDTTLTGHWRDIDRTLTCMEYAGDNSEVSCGGWRHHSKLEEKYILHAYKRKHVCSHFRRPTVASLFRIWLPAMKLASAPNCLEILQPRSALSPSNDWCTLIPLVGVDPFLPNVVCPSLQRRCLMLKRAGDCAAACEESLVGSSRGGRRLQTSVHLTD